MLLPTPIRQPRNHNTTPKPPTPQEPRLQHRENSQALCVGEDVGRDDFVGAEGLFGVDEGGEDAARLFAFA